MRSEHMWTAKRGQVGSQAKRKEPGSTEDRWKHKERTQEAGRPPGARGAEAAKGQGDVAGDTASYPQLNQESQAAQAYSRARDENPTSSRCIWLERKHHRGKQWACSEISSVQMQPKCKRRAPAPAIFLFRISALKDSDHYGLFPFSQERPQSYHLWELWIDSVFQDLGKTWTFQQPSWDSTWRWIDTKRCFLGQTLSLSTCPLASLPVGLDSSAKLTNWRLQGASCSLPEGHSLEP